MDANEQNVPFRSGKAPRPQSALAASQFIDDEVEEVDMDEPEDDEGGDMVDDDEVFREQPDVLEYLDQWDMPLTDKVSMLRTAANYLTSLAKNQNPDLRNRRLK